MTDSMSLLSAQISFLASHLVLVHIPNEFYPFFAQPLLRILFGEDHEEDASSIPWTNRHDFLNFSITPVGCSLICSRYLVDKYLAGLAKQFNLLLDRSKPKSTGVEISSDEHVVIQVDGQGIDAGQRVLELTAPLAMAGISIFFITTYFSDYILVPSRARDIVTTTLRQRGFVFSTEAEAYVSQLSPTLQQNHNQQRTFDRPGTASSSGSEGRGSHFGSTPTTPPAKDIPELQIRTFTKLSKNGIAPIVDPHLRLVSCAGRRDDNKGFTRKLERDLVQVLLASNSGQSALGASRPYSDSVSLPVRDINSPERPDLSATYLSITLSEEPVSILIEERLLPRFGDSLLGSKGEEDILTPIILDLRSLGWNATGIVGGVAGRLSQGAVSFEPRLEDAGLKSGPLEISFLSSAKAGSVIVQAKQLIPALRALEMGMEEVEDSMGQACL